MTDESSVSEREDPVSERRDHGSDSSDESDDADFNPNESVTTVEQQALTVQHIEEWMSIMSRDDLMSLSLTLHHVLVNQHSVKKVHAAQTIAEVTGKGKRTVRRWRKLFYHNAGTFPAIIYQRWGILWRDEELCEASLVPSPTPSFPSLAVW